MRLTKELAKKCMAIATALTLVGGMAVGIPVSVYALEDPHYGNGGTVNENEELNDNQGTIEHNRGTINTNNGAVNYNHVSAIIETNNGTLYTNNGSVTVNSNSGSINENGHTVGTNNGTIEYNDGGIITTNNGSVTRNYSDSSITYNYGTVGTNLYTTNDYAAAQIDNNFGTVSTNKGVVTNNYGGSVNNVYDADHDTTGIVKNQYYSISVTGPTDTTVTYGTDITDPIASDAQGNTKRYIQVTNNQQAINNISGQITISTDADHEITGENKQVDTQGTITYSLTRQDDGTYLITITSLSANVALTNADLGLTVQAIQQQIPNVDPENVIIRVDSSIQITEEDETGSNRAVSDTAPVTGNVVTAAQISAMIESALAAAPEATILDIDFGNDPSLTVDSLIALCEKNNVVKRCHFTHNGMKFVLFIPVIDPTSAAYQQCKALLDAEEGKQAGPIRLSHIFKPVGFNCLGE